MKEAKMKSIKSKMIIMFLISMLLVGTLGSVTVFAATIGQPLTAPEKGWTRYDQNDPKISYANGDWYTTSLSGRYGGTGSGCRTQGGIISFQFIGSKMRLIMEGFYTHSKSISVVVDGKDQGSFSIADVPKDSRIIQMLAYEVTGLSNSKHSVKIIDNSKELSIDAIDLDGQLVDKDTPNPEPVIDVVYTGKSVKVGQVFTTDVVARNVTNNCAQDITLKYDTKLFQLIGTEDVPGIKIYKEDTTATNGAIRFITAIQGKQNVIVNEGTVLKLKFKAISTGTGNVDATKGRIADNANLEMDVTDSNCGEATITVEGYNDVNRSGEFTLLDLGIAAWYFGDLAKDTDITKYDADVVVNGTIDDNDLKQITNQIISNANYGPNL